MIKRYQKIISAVLFIAASVLLPLGTQATTANERLKSVIESRPTYDTATDDTTLTVFLGTIVSVFLGLLGVLFTALIIYAGYNWMTAVGESEKVEKAQRTIRVAVIGLIITIGAFAIWRFVFVRIIGGSTQGTTTASSTIP